MKTVNELRDEETEQFLSSLGKWSECFGLIGRGYPNSLYKVYVRATQTSPWWCFDLGAAPATVDPIEYQANLPVERRAAAAWVPLHYLVNFTHHPDKFPLAKLMARAEVLCDM